MGSRCRMAWSAHYAASACGVACWAADRRGRCGSQQRKRHRRHDSTWLCIVESEQRNFAQRTAAQTRAAAIHNCTGHFGGPDCDRTRASAHRRGMRHGRDCDRPAHCGRFRVQGGRGRTRSLRGAALRSGRAHHSIRRRVLSSSRSAARASECGIVRFRTDGNCCARVCEVCKKGPTQCTHGAPVLPTLRVCVCSNEAASRTACHRLHWRPESCSPASSCPVSSVSEPLHEGLQGDAQR